MSNVIYMQSNRDYCENREDAQELVDRLLKYYHSRGQTRVKVWLEPTELPNKRRLYNIRSNIVFKTPYIF